MRMTEGRKVADCMGKKVPSGMVFAKPRPAYPIASPDSHRSGKNLQLRNNRPNQLCERGDIFAWLEVELGAVAIEAYFGVH